ncbi:MAG: hypothetical protein WCI05_18190 [Myxococcales bacterium]
MVVPRFFPTLVFCLAVFAAGCSRDAPPPSLNAQPVRVDASKKILPWPRTESPYAHVMALAWDALKNKFPVQPNGLKTYLTYSRFDPDTLEGIGWPHNPAGLNAMLVDAAVGYYAFSGDDDVIDLVRETLDHQLSHGTTPRDFVWAHVPFASSDPGSIEYSGADDSWCDGCGRGDGVGVLEPDKVGELGYGYLRFHQLTGDQRYLDAAIDCADALARTVRTGDAAHSPWPFRVVAETGEGRDEYSSHVLGALQLFDELVRLGLGDTAAYARARALTWTWLQAFPMKNGAWSGYFEDIPPFSDPSENPNQYAPLETARFLVEHGDIGSASQLVAWTRDTFAVDANEERGMQYGAEVLSEQQADMAKMASHTARYAAMLALLYEKTGDDALRERAFRSFNWATYMCDSKGIVAVGEDKNEGYWFTDGYADYVRHFLRGMASVPDWAPPSENHILRSSSVITTVTYGEHDVRYSTFDQSAEELLRLVELPSSVEVEDRQLKAAPRLDGDSYVVLPLRGGGVTLKVRHVTGRGVRIRVGYGE